MIQASSPNATASNLISALHAVDPRSTAIIDAQGNRWQFSDLLAQVYGIRDVLLEQGIRPGDRVAYASQHGISAATTFLGIAAFATAVPLSPSLAEEELDFALDDVGATTVLTHADAPQRLRSSARRLQRNVIELEEPLKCGWSDSTTSSLDLPKGSDVSIVLYTSGTTASPKRIALTHAHVISSCHNISNAISLQPNDRCLNPMPLFHTHGLVAGFLAPLLSGGSVILPDACEPNTVLRGLWELGPTWYTAVPTIHQSIVNTLAQDRTELGEHSLRVIRSASAPLPPTVMASLEQHFGVPVIETYGMTEATNQITSNALPPGQRKPGSAGRPVGFELKVSDPTGRPLPPRTQGEVWIRGQSLISEYEGNPTATSAAFVEGWFRTGDLGFLDEDGYVFLQGRSKECINRGGEMVEPRAIDEALLTHPSVLEAAAFPVEHPTLGEDIAAAVVLQQGSSTTEAQLREHLKPLLSESKVPNRVISVCALPKGATGKIQRSLMAKQLEAELIIPYVAPATPFEEELAKIWVEVLKESRIGRDDNFFALGADSLAATLALTRVNDRFGVNLGIRQLFESPTMKDQALLIFEAVLGQREELAGRGTP